MLYLHSAHPYKKKRYSLTYYLKYVLWRKLKRYWKKRRAKKLRKTAVKPPTVSLVGNNRGSDEKIELRDFWGSKYGSQWLFAKHKLLQHQQLQLQQNVNHNRLIEIIDAFKTTDLKYAKRHQQVDDQHTTPTSRRSRKSQSGHEDGFVTNPLATNSKCPCARRQARTRKIRKDGFETDASDWSLSTLQIQQRPYSKWPPHPPPGAKHCCGREEQLATILARQHAYVYNWLHVDQLQSRCKLTLSREYLDQVRTRIARLKSANRRHCRSYISSKCSDGGSDWTSTLSRRERSKMIKRQIRAKEKSSVLWLLSKAFETEIPCDLLEPFTEIMRRLKPKIVHSLANAELYCLALVNIYADPNYHNLDHQGIVQVLMRKGVSLVESREAPLTETTLVQTAPIRMGAHMAVIDGIMSLYIKEVLIPDKIVEVVKKFSHVDVNSEMPSNSEEAAVLWINKCCGALEQEIRSDCGADEERKLPKIPVLQEISDVSDGCCLAAVISYYCPKYFKWQDVCWNNPISLGDSIHNLQLIKKFCSDILPRDINFFTLEDLLYLHPSIKENVLAFIADLLYMFVIFRAACVTQRKKSVVQESSHIPLESSKSLSSFPSHKNPALCSPIPNLRSESYSGSTTSLPDIRPGSRARNSGSKEKLCEKVLTKKSNFSNDDMGSNELQRTNSVGMVNGWKATTLPHVSSTDSVGSCARNINSEIPRLPAEGESASSHQSQPSISSVDDNGLPKHLIHASRATLYSQGSLPQRESLNFGIRKFSESSLHTLRSSGDGHAMNGIQDQRKSRKNLEDYYNQLAGVDGPIRSISASNIIEGNRRKCSSNSHGADSVPESASSQSSGICLSDVDIKNTFSTTSFAQLSKLRDSSSHHSINIVYMPHEREMLEKEKFSTKGSKTNVKRVDGEGKKTTFAALPNTTTWQQQHAVNSNFPPTDSGHETPTEPVDNLLNAQLCNIKMKLEDKKRKIELKKKRMEMLWKKQRQKLGKAAFLQAVSKGQNNDTGTPDSGTGKEVSEAEIAVRETIPPSCNSPSMVKRMSMQEIAADLDNMQKKWLNKTDISDQISIQDDIVEPSVDIDNENIDLQTSIEHLTTSLTDLQLDISRISLQQEQVENLMNDSIDDSSHFFLHDPSISEKSPESFNRSDVKWYFDESAMSVRQYPPSPQVDGLNLCHKQPDVPFSSLPQTFSPVKAVPKEELYSKVIKPDKHQRQGPPLAKTMSSALNRQNIPTETLAVISNADLRKRSTKSKGTTEIHVVLPQVPDNKPTDFINPEKKSNEDKQGFYIPLEKESRKPKPRPQKNLKTGENTVPNSVSVKNVPTKLKEDTNSLGFVIGADLVHPDPNAETEMARRKEMIMNMSIQRKAEYERKRIQKEKEYAKLKEEERRKQEELERKREEEKRRREAILEQYRQRKLQEELEKEGALLPKETIGRFTAKSRSSVNPVKRRDNRLSMVFTKPSVELRNNCTSMKQLRKESKPRPRSAYVHANSDLSSLLSLDHNAANKRNSQIFTGRDVQDFDLDSLNSASTSASSHDRNRSPNNFFPPHRNANLQIPEGSAPSSDGASDTASNGSSAAAGDYTGPKLFVKPAAKSNRGIIMNAINTVLAGAVNEDTKKKVLRK